MTVRAWQSLAARAAAVPWDQTPSEAAAWTGLAGDLHWVLFDRPWPEGDLPQGPETGPALAWVWWLLWCAADPDLAAPGEEVWRQGFGRARAGLIRDLVPLGPPQLWAGDPDRREEWTRRLLAAWGFSVEGETEAQSADRLAALDTVEQRRLEAATRAAQKRAQELREALARKEAEEAASKWNRE